MIVIIDHGCGNFGSVSNALTHLGIEHQISNDSDVIRAADRLILPGTGAFATAMDNLKTLNLIEILNEEVLINRKPVLGICLGMQLMCQTSYELGKHEGLGWIDATVYPFAFEDSYLRVPHVGWNDVVCRETAVFSGGRSIQTFYFAHSYYVKVQDQSVVSGRCRYGIEFACAIQQDNIVGVQFHPEKSQYEGLELLRKFAGEDYAEKTTDCLSIPEEWTSGQERAVFLPSTPW